MPPLGRVGVSKKIDNEKERRVLRGIMNALKPPKGVGFVCCAQPVPSGPSQKWPGIWRIYCGSGRALSSG